MNLKIRHAQLNKVPCMLIIGDKETENSTISIRLRTGEQLQGQSIEDFIKNLKKVIADREKDYSLLET